LTKKIMNKEFDIIINRKCTGSVKWDLADSLFETKGVLPMWVADMDFRSPGPVIEALEKRAGHGVFGYNAPMDGCYDAIINWARERHGWDIQREWILFTPGVVPALNFIIQTYTRPGDRVIVQKPVYYPFMRSIRNNGREIVNNPLKLENRRYVMDFDDLEKKAPCPRTKLLVLCNPHNPVGRSWTEDELLRLGDICIKHDIIVLSDEIHSDLIFDGSRHWPLGSLSPGLLKGSITAMSPSKTFNLSGLQTSYVIIADGDLRGEFSATLENLGIMGPGIFGTAALEAAYNHGGPWLVDLLAYIGDNYRFLKAFVEDEIPAVKVIEPEATYLVWMDFRKLGLDNHGLRALMRERAGVALDDGHIFGSPEGDGFQRINIGCPRALLEKGLEAIRDAVRSL